MTIALPKEITLLLDQLNQNGFEAFIVGGCVRDSIIGRPPMDWDVTTSASPSQIKAIFPKTIDTGLQHGTVTVVLSGSNYEITTYRIDGKYEDHRRPKKVQFTSNLCDDLSRRDFTINAIAYHPKLGFVDPFNGILDIERNVLRAVGNANTRFEEDALRMLRAIRFSSQLHFGIEAQTLAAIQHNHALIQNISQERIREELTKILTSRYPLKFSLLKETGLLKYTMPEFEVCFETPQNHPYHIYDVGIHSLTAVAAIDPCKILRWAMLLHDIGKPSVKSTDDNEIDHFYGHPQYSVDISTQILKRLKFDNASIGKILRLIEHHDRDISPSATSVRRTLSAVGKDIFEDLLKVKEADAKAQNLNFLTERQIKLEKIKKIYLDILEKNECLSIKDLNINGKDLLVLGFPQNKIIGEILEKLLELVVENPKLNTHFDLTRLALDLFSSKLNVDFIQ